MLGKISAESIYLQNFPDLLISLKIQKHGLILHELRKYVLFYYYDSKHINYSRQICQIRHSGLIINGSLKVGKIHPYITIKSIKDF